MSASQTAIGESSNLAQLALTYTYNFDDQKYKDYVCILSVLAQLAIDSAKRRFDIDIDGEISRIKRDMDIDKHKYPVFWTLIRPGFNKKAEDILRQIGKVSKMTQDEIPDKYLEYGDTISEIIIGLKAEYDKKNKINTDLKCPMNYLYNIKFQKVRNPTSTLPMSDFFVKHRIGKDKRRTCKKVEELIQKYSLQLYAARQNNIETDKNSLSDDDYLLLRSDFEQLIEDIKQVNISKNYIELMSWLIDRTFVITPELKRNKKNTKSVLRANRVILLKTLYTINPVTFMKCWQEK